MSLPLHRFAHPDADRIIRCYPRLFGHPPFPTRLSTLVHGFLCGPGWQPLVDDLAAHLDRVVQKDGLDRLVVVHVAESAGVLEVRHQQGNHETKVLIAAAAEASLTICEDCGVPSSRSVRSGWGTTLCAGCYADYMRCVSAAIGTCDDRPVRLTTLPANFPWVKPDAAQHTGPAPPRGLQSYCDMCCEPADRGTVFGGSLIDRHCVRTGDGALIGTFVSDGYWTAGNGEVLCGICVDSLVGHMLWPPAGLIYDPRRNRSVQLEGGA